MTVHRALLFEHDLFGKPLRTFPDHALAHPPRQPQHEHQHFRDGLVEVRRDLLAEFDLGERAGQNLVLLDRDVVGLGDLDDFCADRAPALGDHYGSAAALLVMQRDCELGCIAHVARSRKCPARAGAGCGGVPSRTTMSPGLSSAFVIAWLSSPMPARSCCAVAGRSAHIRTKVLSPLSVISACTGPAGSTLSVNRARQARLAGSADSLPPSREISNCAIAVPCGVRNGISKFHCGTVGSMRCPLASTRSGSEATWSKVCRAIAASVSSSRRCMVAASGVSGVSDAEAMDCGDGSAPRTGGGVARAAVSKMWPSGTALFEPGTLPIMRGRFCVTSCSRLAARPADMVRGIAVCGTPAAMSANTAAARLAPRGVCSDWAISASGRGNIACATSPAI